MQKKLIAACVSLVAFVAFAAVPAIASASPVLTFAGGGTVPTGTAVTGFSTNLKFVAGSSEVKCTENDLAGTLITNSGTNIEATLSKATFTGAGGARCATNESSTTIQVTPEELPWCLRSTGTNEVTIIGGDCGTAKPIRFVLDAFIFGFSVGSCTYESSQTGGHVLGSYPTNVSGLVVTVKSDQTFARKSCTSTTLEERFGASGLLTGSFTITAGGRAVLVS